MFNNNQNAMEVFMMSVFGSDYYNTKYLNNNKFNNNNYNNNNNFNNNYNNFNHFINYNQNPYMNNEITNNDFWKHGYNTQSQQNIPQNPSNDQIYNCVFKTTQGFTFNIPFNAQRTTEDLIQTFFKRVDREDLFGKGAVFFLHNASRINHSSKQPIIKLFKTNISPIIMVSDVQNLIGA